MGLEFGKKSKGCEVVWTGLLIQRPEPCNVPSYSVALIETQRQAVTFTRFEICRATARRRKEIMTDVWGMKN
jgi:hypothetical protein